MQTIFLKISLALAIAFLAMLIGSHSLVAQSTTTLPTWKGIGLEGKRVAFSCNAFFTPNLNLHGESGTTLGPISGTTKYEADREVDRSYFPPKVNVELTYAGLGTTSLITAIDFVRLPNFTLGYPVGGNPRARILDTSVVSSYFFNVKLGGIVFKEFAPYGSYFKFLGSLGNMTSTTYKTTHEINEAFGGGTEQRIIREKPLVQNRAFLGATMGWGRHVPLEKTYMLNYGIQGNLLVPLESGKSAESTWSYAGLGEYQLVEIFIGIGFIK